MIPSTDEKAICQTKVGGLYAGWSGSGKSEQTLFREEDNAFDYQ
jgi:hypothetical protein